MLKDIKHERDEKFKTFISPYSSQIIVSNSKWMEKNKDDNITK